MTQLRNEVLKQPLDCESLSKAWDCLLSVFSKGFTDLPEVSLNGKNIPDPAGFADLIARSSRVLSDATDVVIEIAQDYQRLRQEIACSKDRVRPSLGSAVRMLKHRINEAIPLIRNCKRVAKNARRMDWREADRIGKDIAKTNKKFLQMSVREQAKKIGCAFATWTKTPTYKSLNKNTDVQINGIRETGFGRRKGMGFDFAIDKASYDEWSERNKFSENDERSNETLAELIKDQVSDFEPSPLSNHHTKVCVRKKM